MATGLRCHAYLKVSTLNYFTCFIKNKPRLACFISGLFSSLIFAPIFFFPLICTFAILNYHVFQAKDFKNAGALGFFFGLGHFITSLHWINFAVLMYIQELWYILPFSAIGLPCLMALFICASCIVASIFKKSKAYDLYFTIVWVLFEWIRSWFLTGLPWNLVGYSLAFSEIMSQLASVFGILGLSFIVVYIGSSFRCYIAGETLLFKKNLLISAAILVFLYIFGFWRINVLGKIGDTNLLVRLVQANINQNQQSSIDQFIDNIRSHIHLSDSLYFSPSLKNTETIIYPHLIVWPESSLPTFINNPSLLKMISGFLQPNQTLITGSMRQKSNKEYVGMYGISHMGNIIFSYDKIHLVPFGEYIPFKDSLPKFFASKLANILKKIIDLNYFKGSINQNNMIGNFKIKPLICYESIFASEVKTLNSKVDVIINITNDNWFGHSAGPYQHFYMTKIRAIENGLPLVIAANNGISAIIDPLGRVLKKTNIDTITYLDGYIPNKLSGPTLYSKHNQGIMIFLLICLFFTIEVIKQSK